MNINIFIYYIYLLLLKYMALIDKFNNFKNKIIDIDNCDENPSVIFEGVEILLDTKGFQLIYLKKMIDYDRNLPNLEYFVFTLIPFDNERNKLLVHFLNEAHELKRNGFDKYALISDIHDTVYPSHYDNLSENEKFNVLNENGSYKNINVFHDCFEYLVFITSIPFNKLNYIKVNETLDNFSISERSICMGKLWKNWQNKSRMAKKMRTIKNIIQIYPEYKFIWVGDSGESDCDIGKSIMDISIGQIPLILIHKINKKYTFRQNIIDWIQGVNKCEENRNYGVFMFYNYIEAKNIFDSYTTLNLKNIYDKNK